MCDTNDCKPFDLVGTIMAYEQGDLTDEETVAFFQHLVNTGLAWELQGSYGRTARAMLDQDLITNPRQTIPYNLRTRKLHN